MNYLIRYIFWETEGQIVMPLMDYMYFFILNPMQPLLSLYDRVCQQEYLGVECIGHGMDLLNLYIVY